MGLKQRVTRCEEKIKSAKMALKLARVSLSKNNIWSIVTAIIAVAAVIVSSMKK